MEEASYRKQSRTVRAQLLIVEAICLLGFL